MTPSVWSVLVIFVLAPLGIAVLTTAVVLLLASPTRRPMAQPAGEANEQSQDEGPVVPDEDDLETSDAENLPQ